MLLSSKAVQRISLITLIVLLIACSVPWLLNSVAKKQFADKQFTSSHQFFTAASTIAWYDKPVILKSKADASLANKNYETAIKEYEKALENAPDSLICPIRYNWALSYYLHAESTEDEDTTKATRLYLEALRVITVKECFDSPEHKDNFIDLKERIEQQLKKLTQSQESQTEEDDKPSDNVDLDAILDNNDAQLKQQLKYLQDISSYETDVLNNSDDSYRFVY
jgi:tetratricopeptide (TPR) repeat protein